MRKIYLSVLTLVISLLGTLVSCEGIEPDKPEIPNFSKYYNQSGLYLGIIGFNDILEEKEYVNLKIHSMRTYDDIYVARVAEAEKIPDTHLTLCKIDVGEIEVPKVEKVNGLIEVLCGAPDVRVGMLTAWIGKI